MEQSCRRVARGWRQNFQVPLFSFSFSPFTHAILLLKYEQPTTRLCTDEIHESVAMNFSITSFKERLK
ncbi:hypothetical protein BX666DRAFT_1899204 [Dichotomocladium elegans]|nr:hypothetical protein BX666DRAFT_1899204 [Dichotomocladium elegans]